MKALLLIMTGIGFTLGVVLGLLLHLPTDSLPAQHASALSASDSASSSSANSFRGSDARLKRQATAVISENSEMKIELGLSASSSSLARSDGGEGGIDDDAGPSLHLSHWNAQRERRKSLILANELSANAEVNSDERRTAGKGGQRPLNLAKQSGRGKLETRRLSEDSGVERNGDGGDLPVFSRGLDSKRKEEGDEEEEKKEKMKANKNNRRRKPSRNSSTANSPSLFENAGVGGEEERLKGSNEEGSDRNTTTPSREDRLYLSSIVRGVYWTDKVEASCSKPFAGADTDAWRTKVQGLDVVKMETGCGRMQNRLLTFRDASKACARYRLNTDQIQGDIFSYYLAKLLRIPNLPPTVLADVNSVDKKWRTVHLDLSLAQWADSKLVVLTKFIDDLKVAHIPKEFRDERRQLHPVLAHLGTKSHPELCELVQWSDLIVFDYLTANLDRVINNMFNSQWNDQMMASPTHNLEQLANGGGLVFLDNESGLFHGFRLIDKYEKLHRALLDSVCVFRASTAENIKRLATSGSVGKELRALLESNEALARHVPTMPAKNVKILEKRIQQVYQQIVKCEQEFNNNNYYHSSGGKR